MADAPTAVPGAASAGPMTAEEIETLRNLQGSIDHCIENGLTFQTAIRTLAHDLQAIRSGLPERWTDVAGIAAELEAMANDPEIQRELRAIEAESSRLGGPDPEGP